MNVTYGPRQPDVVEQCYTNPVRDDLTVDADERDVYDYETVAENRLESDALEFCHNSGSQANLIASDGEDSFDVDSCNIQKTQYKQDKKFDNDFDDITLVSNLTLDTNSDKYADSDKVAENQEN